MDPASIVMRQSVPQITAKEKEFILKDRLPVNSFCSIRPVFFMKFDEFELKNIELRGQTIEILSFSESSGRIINVRLKRREDYVEVLFCLEYDSYNSNDDYYRDKLNRFHEVFLKKIETIKSACLDCIYGYQYNLTKNCKKNFIQNNKTCSLNDN